MVFSKWVWFVVVWGSLGKWSNLSILHFWDGLNQLMGLGPVVWIPRIPENERDCYLRAPGFESQTTNYKHWLSCRISIFSNNKKSNRKKKIRLETSHQNKEFPRFQKGNFLTKLFKFDLFQICNWSKLRVTTWQRLWLLQKPLLAKQQLLRYLHLQLRHPEECIQSRSIHHWMTRVLGVTQSKASLNKDFDRVILLMEEILHHMGCIKPCK